MVATVTMLINTGAEDHLGKQLPGIVAKLAGGQAGPWLGFIALPSGSSRFQCHVLCFLLLPVFWEQRVSYDCSALPFWGGQHCILECAGRADSGALPFGQEVVWWGRGGGLGATGQGRSAVKRRAGVGMILSGMGHTSLLSFSLTAGSFCVHSYLLTSCFCLLSLPSPNLSVFPPSPLVLHLPPLF